MAKKKKKIRGLCLVLSFVLSIGFCLAGIPGKKILADEPNGVDENAYLIVGDEVIVANGVWADVTKVEGDVYTSAKGFTVEKDPNRYDYRVELTPGGNYGAFFLSNVKVLFIPPESESENDAINIVKFNFTTENTNFADGHTNTVFDGILNNKSDNWDERIESQISGYSIYCMSGSIDFAQERASFPTYNLAGGIRIGNNNGLMFPEGTFNIGTSDIPAEVGIANAYQADEQLEPYNVFLKGSTNLTIYADTVFKFPDEGKLPVIRVDNESILTAVSTIDDVLEAPANVVVAFGGEVHFNGVLSYNGEQYECMYIDVDKPKYDINFAVDDNSSSGKINNTTIVAAESDDDTVHYSMNCSGNKLDLVSKDPANSTLGWDMKDIYEGGGFEILEGTGFLMGIANKGTPEENYSYCLMQGSKLKIKVLPKYGHQFDTSFLNDQKGVNIKADPQSDAAVYEITVPRNGVHLVELYQPVKNDADMSGASGIGDGSIELSKDEDTTNFNGNLRLTAKDAADADEDEFMAELGEDAEDYTCYSVVDLTVNSVITKGDTNGVWASDDITEFKNKAKVRLALKEDVEAGTKVQIVRDHNGTKTVIEAEVFTEDDVSFVEFDSDQFSTYAILLENEDDNNDTPVTPGGDGTNNTPVTPGGDGTNNTPVTPGGENNPPEPPEGGDDEGERIVVTDEATGVSVELTAWEGAEHYKADVDDLKDDIANATPEELAAVKEMFEIPDGYEILKGYEIFMLSNVNDPDNPDDDEYGYVFGRDPIITIPVGDLADSYDLKLIYYVNDEWETFVKYPEFTIKDGKLIVGDVETDGQFFIIGKALAKAADVEEPAETETKKPASDGSPKTGDSSNPAFMFMLLIASAGMIIMLRKSKNRE